MTYRLEKAVYVWKPHYGRELYTSFIDYLERHKAEYMANIKKWDKDFEKEWSIRHNENQYETKEKPTYMDTLWMSANYNSQSIDSILRVKQDMEKKYPKFTYRIVMVYT
jgi:hypothetical protein